MSSGGLPHEPWSCHQDADIIALPREADADHMCTAVEPLMSAECVFIAAESLVPDGQLNACLSIT